ncbi:MULTISPECIES: DUF2079 domain-containing protein [unclassified Microcoleus]|uniref:DUF2079 domain-containing protein n=1 Tax=unclassified Microcoleus TaxID=2642155 RepID=UPI001D9A0BD2|nr:MULTISPECIES: DUF2079 domain-containing protein [unclassified Microcoleus]MCC3465204.1 DUF2079 domain-containing protein [Microcoleus sp. PH2017_06_SFM_O_A]MCC3503298.1 DUF2079 domain-containing protein [Microcoleus sp. PH2017_19_SFW_U_A]TAE11403.1 MAG: DUF2079 domain-containing protein [Oscillatoriales cyanobacterium]MCC3494130.1 DUF2079 domain-containing protein [Microcoleus sp. PH2017_16_JOR_D_A]MCC3522391.1 DUF2079 domain-containing protein [Microcoleus sp. PH2017_20_SFW_D_A]
MKFKPLDSWNNQTGFRQVTILAAIFFILVLTFSIIRYESFLASYDHGLFNQVFWNSIHGRFFQSSLSSGASSASLIDRQLSSPSYIHLGQHFVINFLIWMPIYALFPSPVTLIVLQVALIAVAGIVLYLLARHYLSVPLSVMIVASYYGANGVIGPTLGNFYEHCQLPLFIFSLLLALEKQKWVWFWIFAALTLGIREETGISLFGIGAYLIVSRRYLRAGIALCVLSFSYVSLITNVVMPMFSDDNSRLYLANFFRKFVKTENPSTLELLWGIVTQPQIIIEVFFNDLERRIRFILGLWLPLAFIPVVSLPAWIMSSFPLLVLLVQVYNKSATSINTRYTLSVIPLLVYAVILWWSEHPERFKPRLHRFWIGCIGLSLLFTLTSNPYGALYFLSPYSFNPLVYQSLPEQLEHATDLQTVLKLIPQAASVSTSGYIVSHLSGRRNLIRLEMMQFRDEEGKVVDVDYALLDLWQLQQHNLKVPLDRGRVRGAVRFTDEALRNGSYGIAEVLDGVVLVQKGITSKPEVLAAWSKLRQEIQPLMK